jgi:membrane-bound lytic murein transglycosylase D
MKTFFLLLAFFSSCYSFAQISVVEEIKEKMKNEEKMITEEDQIIEDDQDDLILEPDSSFVVPEEWDTNFDNLLNSWYIKNHTNKLNHTGYQENIPTSDSVFMDRLSKLPNIIELPYNTIVRNSINFYVERRRELVEYMLGLETFYFPMIEETLDKYGLPIELKYLTIIESALNATALSKAGASGLWQFIISTGKIYGLEINSLIDDRRDPIKSTDAACRFLKDLYETFGDWNLAIAAYNCGGGNVNKAIKRAGGKKDFWAIYPYLPKETRLYIPYFIAANPVMNYYAYHQLYPVQTSLPLSTDTIMVTQMIHFDQIADVLQIEKEMLRALNPQYKIDIIPGNIQPQILKLPAIQAYAYVEKENEIAAYRADELFTSRTYVKENTSTAVNRAQRIIHKVARGETILSIADKYGVTTANIRKWNGLKSNRVVVGYNLLLYVNNGGYIASNTSAKPASQPVSSSSSATKNTTSSTKSTGLSIATVQYKVQSGDSFYTIAQKFPGYSSTDLMKLNNVTKTALKVGQYIRVPKI